MDKKVKKPIWKKWWVWMLAVIIIGSAISGQEKSNKATVNSNNISQSNLHNEITDNKENEEESTKIKAGTYKIGVDLPEGEYVFLSTRGMGYIEVASDSTGELSSIISNDNVLCHTYITVKDGEYLKIKSGEAYAVSEAPSLIPKDGVYKDGTYIVGKDIPAGEYKVTVNSSMGIGYIEVASNSRGTLDSIITNDNLTEDSYITVKDGQYLKLTGAQINVN